jgi:hypothetical protein
MNKFSSTINRFESIELYFAIFHFVRLFFLAFSEERRFHEIQQNYHFTWSFLLDFLHENKIKETSN